jgi:hypothetical protein
MSTEAVLQPEAVNLSREVQKETVQNKPAAVLWISSFTLSLDIAPQLMCPHSVSIHGCRIELEKLTTNGLVYP